ncbi:MAG TPA: purine-binding chemotaxis protein CheW [bacterium]|nr:purine-binding chemotaxis protein CheW [bacterium]
MVIGWRCAQNMDNIQNFILFVLDEHDFVIPLESVLRIARAVSVKPLPNAPDIVEGILNVQGEVIPVVNLRKRFDFPPRPIEIEDHFIIAKTARRVIAILVDEVRDIIESQQTQIVNRADILPNMEFIEGVIKTDQDMYYIQDLDKLLSLEEEERLDASLKKSGSGDS